MCRYSESRLIPGYVPGQSLFQCVDEPLLKEMMITVVTHVMRQLPSYTRELLLETSEFLPAVENENGSYLYRINTPRGYDFL